MMEKTGESFGWVEKWNHEIFPGDFSFYEEGQIVAADHLTINDQILIPQHSIGIAFDLFTTEQARLTSLPMDDVEFRSLIVVVFEKGLDHPLYTEVGNTIASRIADNINHRSKHGVEAMISPPKLLTESQMDRLSQIAGPKFQKMYTHQTQHKDIEVQVIVIPLGIKEAAHA